MCEREVCGAGRRGAVQVRARGWWVGGRAVGVLRLAVCASVSLVRVLEKMSLGEYLGRRNYYHMDT